MSSRSVTSSAVRRGRETPAQTRPASWRRGDNPAVRRRRTSGGVPGTPESSTTERPARGSWRSWRDLDVPAGDRSDLLTCAPWTVVVVLLLTKRVLIGRPLASSESEHQRLSKRIALATFSSDAISSTAYATEEILFVIAAGASSLALGLQMLVPIAIVVALLLAIVTISYRQTIFAYPSGGG